MESELKPAESSEREYVRGQGVPQDWRFYAAFFTMAITILAAGFDATMISVVLPVSQPFLLLAD